MMKKSFKIFLYLAIFFFLSQFAYALNIVELSPGYYPNTSRGRPLATADIYVGVPDLDPEILANQKILSVQQENGTIVAVSQPIHTNAGGVPQYAGSPVVLLVEGDYSLKVLDSHGVQIYYVPSTAYEKYLVSGNYYYPDYTEVDQGVVGGGETVTDILADVGITENATIYFSHDSGGNTTTYTFTTNTTITDNFNIIIEEGAILDGAGILTIDGPFDTKLSQIFGISITISFNTGLVKEIYSEWWGAIGDGVTNDATALQAAIDVGISSMIPVQLLSRTYKTNSTLTIYKAYGFQLKGTFGGSNSTTPYATVIDISGITAGNYGIIFGNGTNKNTACLLQDFVIDGGAAGVSGLKMDLFSMTQVNRVHIIDCGDHGIHFLDESFDNYFHDIVIHSCGDEGSSEYAMYFEAPAANSMNNFYFSNLFIHNFNGHGIYMDATGPGQIISCRFNNTKIHYNSGAPGTTIGAYIRKCNDIIFDNIRFNGAGTECINLDDGCTTIKITNGFIGHAGTYGIEVDDAIDTFIDGITFAVNTTADINITANAVTTSLGRGLAPTATIDINDLGGNTKSHFITDDVDKTRIYYPAHVVTKAIDFASIANGAEDKDTVGGWTGLTAGDVVVVGADADLLDLTATAYYINANNVRLIIANNTGGAVDLPSITFTLMAFKATLN